MHIKCPRIIQGGMGAGVSNWRLAKAVSEQGALGVVSGTALDHVLARRLQLGDIGGHVRRALAAFPLPHLAQRILDAFYVPGGKQPEAPFKTIPMHSADGAEWPQRLCVAANFVEVFLAREGHSNPVGINYLEKIQVPHLPSIYGAMLAGVHVIIVGAGIPLDMPTVFDAFTKHEPACYPLYVSGQEGARHLLRFDPKPLWQAWPPLALTRPDFLPIVSSATLATMLHRRSTSPIQGFIVEFAVAGGHNAPPRGEAKRTACGQPVYGPRDQINVDAIRGIGLPFWLAGGRGNPEGLRSALEMGAAGIQVGTAFALCHESGLRDDIRRQIIREALRGEVSVFTDPIASPTGFPFKVVQIEGSLSEKAVYEARRRVCNLGFLREPYSKADGSIGFRCPAEPEAAFLAKGGTLEQTRGRKCLCNALIANVGMPQRLPDGTEEQCLITLGDAANDVRRFCSIEHPDYSAADVLRVILG